MEGSNAQKGSEVHHKLDVPLCRRKKTANSVFKESLHLMTRSKS